MSIQGVLICLKFDLELPVFTLEPESMIKSHGLIMQRFRYTSRALKRTLNLFYDFIFLCLSDNVFLIVA